MFKISIDVQPLLGKKCGIGQYIWGLIHGLSEIDSENLYSLSFFDTKFRSSNVPVPGPNFFRSGCLIPPRVMRRIWLKYPRPYYDTFFRSKDLYHFCNFIIPPIRTGKKIATIFDFSFLRYPQFSEPRNLGYLQREIKQTLQKADEIITISEFTKTELLHFFNIPENKIHAIHLGIHARFKPNPLVQQKKQILFVGTIEPRKNLETLLKAFELFVQKKDFSDYKLIFAGMKGWLCDNILSSLEKHPHRNKISLLDYVSDEELPTLYQESMIFVYPSFYEGFGLPPLEAMACGTAVIASKVASLPEILGDAAFWIEPHHTEDIASAFEKLVQDTSLRQTLIQKGFEQVKKFSWKKTAEETLKVYLKALEAGKD